MLGNAHKYLILTVLVVLSFNIVNAQYTSKKIKSKHQIYTDSLKSIDYNYVFPILGSGAYKKGFDIPYPIGIMGNYMWMKQGILIDNLQLGLKTDNLDIPLTSVDFIEFGDNINTSYVVNVRPDLWVFPFLNVYGIFGYGGSRTEVNLVAPIALKSVVEQNISTAGFGVMTAFGIGPVWMSIDANWTWSKPELLDKAVNVNVMGIRLGHTFTFKSRPDRNFAIWGGGMRASMSSETFGAVAMKDAIPAETWGRVDEIVENYGIWYDDLPLAQKKIVDASPVPDIIDRLDAADGDAVISYAMDKQVKQLWNGVFGVQFQLNKHWMFRSEAGLIGDRKSLLVSVNYRLLGFKKKS
jgi:hypothetical protein